MKRVNVYDVIREMREQVVKTMQERGIKELAMYLSPEEWAKENDCKYEPDEDGYDEQYDDYKRDESPYVIFFDKYNHGIDYRVDKVTLKTEGLGAPVLEFDCVNDEWGYDDTFGENDLVFLTLYNVYDTLLDRLSIEDEPEYVWVFTCEQAWNEETADTIVRTFATEKAATDYLHNFLLDDGGDESILESVEKNGWVTERNEPTHYFAYAEGYYESNHVELTVTKCEIQK